MITVMKNIPTLVRIAAESLIKQVSIPCLNVNVNTFTDIYKKFQQEKFNFFLDEVKRGTADISIQNLNDYDILHTAYLTQQTLLKTRQQEKIKLLADLFISYCHKLKPEHNEKLTDKYEFILQIIENLSLQEFHLLNILYSYEIQSLSLASADNKLIELSKYWDEFIAKAINNLNISQDYVEALLTKLNGTGLYQTITGMYLGYTGNKGHLTKLFYELINFLQKDPDYAT